MEKSELLFKEGDVVRLKSGSPKMTIHSNDKCLKSGSMSELMYNGEVTCVWFLDSVKKSGSFKQNALELVEN